MKPLDLSAVIAYLVVDGDPLGSARSRVPNPGIYHLGLARSKFAKRIPNGGKTRYRIVRDRDGKTSSLHVDLMLEPVEGVEPKWRLFFDDDAQPEAHEKIEQLLAITGGVLHLRVPMKEGINIRMGTMRHFLGTDEVYYVEVRQPTVLDLIEDLVEKEIT